MSDLCFSSLPLPSASPSSNSCPPAGDEDSRPSALPHSLTPLHSSSSGRVALLGLEREPPPCSRQAANTHCMVPAAVWAAGENSQGAGCRCSPESQKEGGSHRLARPHMVLLDLGSNNPTFPQPPPPTSGAPASSSPCKPERGPGQDVCCLPSPCRSPSSDTVPSGRLGNAGSMAAQAVVAGTVAATCVLDPF